MQVNFQSASYAQNQPSFGMAKLTRRGEEVAKRFIGELPQYAKQEVYVKKNVLKGIIKESQKSGLDPRRISCFFSYGSTQFGDKNAQFVQKQLLPRTGTSTIKSFLAADHRQAVAMLENPKAPANALTESGTVLVDSIKEVFDRNINNPQLSSKKGKKVLDIIKNYLSPEEFAERLAVLSDKLFSK